MSIDINELVQSIATEVLKQLKPESKKACVLVLAERDCLVAEKVRNSFVMNTNTTSSAKKLPVRNSADTLCLPFAFVKCLIWQWARLTERL